MLRDPDEASDVTQETFIRAMKALKPGEKVASFSTWVFTIARNLSLNRLSRNKKAVRLSTSAGNGEDGPDLHVVDEARFANPEEAARARDLSALVWEAAGMLNAKESSVLDLHLRQGLGSAEIAQVMGVSKGNAYTILSRLKNAFEEAVVALMMIKRGRDNCSELDNLLNAEGVSAVSPAARRSVRKHLDACATCQAAKSTMLSPAELLGSFAMVPAPVAVKSSIAGAIQEQWSIVGPAAAASSSIIFVVFAKIWSWLTAPFRLLWKWLTGTKTTWPYQTTAWKTGHVAIAVVAVTAATAGGAAVAGGGSTAESTLITCGLGGSATDPQVDVVLTDYEGNPLAERPINWAVDGASDIRIDPATTLTDSAGASSLTYSRSNGVGLEAHRITASFDGDDEHRDATCAVEVPGVLSDHQTPTLLPPTCSDMVRSTQAGTPLEIELPCANSTEGPVECSLVAPPRNGQLSLDGCRGAYTPNEGFQGEDSFSYRASDAGGDSEVAVARIQVREDPNSPPECSDGSASTAFEEPITINLRQLCDDEDDGLSCEITAQPFSGQVTLNGCTATYTPDQGFWGNDSFRFRASDGVDDSKTAIVRINTAAPPPQPPGDPRTPTPTPTPSPPKPSIISLGCPTSRNVGQSLTCTPSINGSVTSYEWKGGGSPGGGNSKNFTTTFGTPGSKSITLKVCNSGGCDTKDQRVKVTATPPPPPPPPDILSLGCPNSGNVGQQLTCYSSIDGSVTSYTWTGGGSPTSSSSKNFTTTFSISGTKTITLSACNSSGCDFESEQVTVFSIVTPSPDPCTTDQDDDGIPDCEDLCPEQPETYNDYEDWDGCPDEPPGCPGGYTNPAVAAAFNDLQERLGHCAIEPMEVREVLWPDSCLGVVSPEEGCFTIVVPGYWIQLLDFTTDEIYTYHTDCTGDDVIATDFLSPDSYVTPPPPESPGACS